MKPVFCASLMLCLLGGILPTQGYAENLGNLKSYQVEGRSVVITTDAGQKIRVTPYGDYIVRVQPVRSDEAFGSDNHYEMVESHDWPGVFSVQETGARVDLSVAAANGVQVSVSKNPVRLSFAQKQQTSPFLRESGGTLWEGSLIQQDFVIDSQENFVGLGHDYFGRVNKLNLKDQEIFRNYGSTHQRQAPLIVPFYVSSRGYGVFMNSTFPNRFSFGANGRYRFGIDTRGYAGKMDYFVILGPKPLDVIDRYTQLTGRPRLPARAAFGLALSDKGHQPLSQASWWQTKVAEHRAKGWPLDHLVNDNRWRANGGDRCISSFAWDPSRYLDPAGFATWARREGLMVTLDFNRCISARSAGWLSSYNIPKSGAMEFSESAPDFSRQEVRSWWWSVIRDQGLKPAANYPGDALWIDEYDELGPVPELQTVGNGRSWAEMKNYYFFLAGKALVPEGWDKDIGAAKRPFVWMRGMTAGGQRFGTLWSGDINPSYDEMKLQIRGMLAAGISGFPYWGHDAAGFDAAALSEASFDTLYRQWGLAMGSFTPYWKPHGMGWSRWPGDRSVAAQDDAFRFSELRYRLMPYLYSYAHAANQSGAPIARAMMLEYPDQPEAWSADQQYLWGHELLVAPNTTPGNNNVNVWLPAGRWYNFWNDAVVDGGRWVSSYAATGQLPLYARAGAIVPMAKPALGTRFIREDVRELHVYTGADGQFTLIDDDTQSEQYRLGQKRSTLIEYQDASNQLVINAASGSFAGALDARRYEIILHGLKKPFCIALNGQVLPAVATPEQGVASPNGGVYWQVGSEQKMVVYTPSLTVASRHVLAATTGCSAMTTIHWEGELAQHNGTLGNKPQASGQHYVGGLTQVGKSVALTFGVSKAGRYSLTLGYANGGVHARRSVRINGGTAVKLAFPSLGAWDKFARTVALDVTLLAGRNTLVLDYASGDSGVVDVDFVSLAFADNVELLPVCKWPNLYFRGTPNGWGTTPMTCVGDNVWQVDAVFGSTAKERFKFDVKGDWSENYGDNEPDRIADRTGKDISVAPSAKVTIRFNEQNLRYEILPK